MAQSKSGGRSVARVRPGADSDTVYFDDSPRSAAELLRLVAEADEKRASDVDGVLVALAETGPRMTREELARARALVDGLEARQGKARGVRRGEPAILAARRPRTRVRRRLAA